MPVDNVDAPADCTGCGLCCERLGFPPGNPEYIATLPARLALDVITTRDKGFTPDTNADCSWLTPDRQCRHYEYRPPLCRMFRLGGSDCLALRAAAGVASG